MERRSYLFADIPCPMNIECGTRRRDGRREKRKMIFLRAIDLLHHTSGTRHHIRIEPERVLISAGSEGEVCRHLHCINDGVRLIRHEVGGVTVPKAHMMASLSAYLRLVDAIYFDSPSVVTSTVYESTMSVSAICTVSVPTTRV